MSQEKAFSNVELPEEGEKEDEPQQEVPLPLEAGEPVAPEVEEAPAAPGEAGEVVEPSPREAGEVVEPSPREAGESGEASPREEEGVVPLPGEAEEEGVPELSGDESELSEGPAGTPRSEHGSQTDRAEGEASEAAASVEVPAAAAAGAGEGRELSREEVMINQLSAFVNEGLRQRLVHGYGRNIRMPSSIVVRQEEVDAAANGLFQEHGEGDNDEVEHPQPDD